MPAKEAAAHQRDSTEEQRQSRIRTAGYAINPARDLGPRLAHALLPISRKGHSDWGYALVPVVGPLLGAISAGVLMRFLHF